jgi:hypothetical protein
MGMKTLSVTTPECSLNRGHVHLAEVLDGMLQGITASHVHGLLGLQQAQL